MNDILHCMLSSFFTGLSVVLLSYIGLAQHPHKVIIGNIMLLIPGSDLYYTMSSLVNGEQTRFVHHATLLMSEAGAIALGIICAAAIARLAVTLFHRH